MYINVSKILRILSMLSGVVIIGFGVFKFVVAANINQQIASTLVALFGLHLVWFLLWAARK